MTGFGDNDGTRRFGIDFSSRPSGYLGVMSVLGSVRLLGLASAMSLAAPLVGAPAVAQDSFLLGGAVGLAAGTEGHAVRASVTFSHRIGDFSFTSVESSREISSSVGGIPLFLMEFESLDDVMTDYSLLYGRHLGRGLRGWARVAAGPSLVRSSLRASHCTGFFIVIQCDRDSQTSSWALGLAGQLDLLLPLTREHALGLMLSGNLNQEQPFASAGVTYQFFLGF